MNNNFSAYFFLLFIYSFIQYYWKTCLDLCQNFCLSFWSNFSAQLLLLFVYFLFNIIEKLILTHVKILVYFFDNIVKFSSQHMWMMLFIFFLLFYKTFYADQFIFFILWNFHHNMHEQCCLFFFSHSSKHFTWITMLKFNYDDLFDNEKSQKFIKFDKNISNRCCDFFSHINKNRDMLQIR